MGQPTHPLASRLGVNQLWANTTFGVVTPRYGATAIKLWRLISTLLSAAAVTHLTLPPYTRFVRPHPGMPCVSTQTLLPKVRGKNSTLVKTVATRGLKTTLWTQLTCTRATIRLRQPSWDEDVVDVLSDHIRVCSTLVCLQRGNWVIFLIAAFSHESELDDEEEESDDEESWSADDALCGQPLHLWL